MDWLKRNWYWVIPAACLVGYFVWQYVTSKIEVQKQMAKVRAHKIPKDADLTESNVSDN